jgi:hypothetical protein
MEGMKLICKKCCDDPCVLEIGNDEDWPFSCPYDTSAREDGACWQPLDVSSAPDNFERQGICADCARNDETCSMCSSCKDASNFESKKNIHIDNTSGQGRDPKSRYYDVGGIETLDIIKAKLTPEQYRGFLLGNIIKYACRANHKGNFDRDIEKVRFYGNSIFDTLEA